MDWTDVKHAWAMWQFWFKHFPIAFIDHIARITVENVGSHALPGALCLL